MIKVGVIGAGGRMGSESCRAIEADDELQLAAKIMRDDPLERLVDAGVDVALEFTSPATVEGNVRFCLLRGIPTVVGATGLDESTLTELGKLAEEKGVGLFVAPNFALGAVLMMSFAAEAGRYFDKVEIVERHHDKKLDAPSGTALRTASLISSARERTQAEAGRESLPGSRGGDAGGIRIHSMRLPGSVAHQEVVFGGAGETLTIRHDSLDRASFMPGVVLALKKARALKGLTVGLEQLLDE